MPKFCGNCGARLNEATGLCPNCSPTNAMEPTRNADDAFNPAESHVTPANMEERTKISNRPYFPDNEKTAAYDGPGAMPPQYGFAPGFTV